MKKGQVFLRQGFTLIEVIIVVAVIGILAAIAIPHYLFDVRARAQIAEAKMEIRDLQEIVVFYLGDSGELPTIENLSLLYRGNVSIIDRYKMVGNYQDANNGHGNDWDGYDDGNPGNSHKPDKDYGDVEFVIYSVTPINGVNYVYGINDDAPKVAYGDENPLGSMIDLDD